MLKRSLQRFGNGFKSTNRIKANKMSRKEPLNMKQKDFAEKLSKLSDENLTYLFLAARALIQEEIQATLDREGSGSRISL